MRRLYMCSVVLLGGCTTQLATNPVSSELKAVAGIPYTLPALQYRATVKRTLTDCKVEADVLKPEFDVTVEVVPTYVEGETFVADYRALSGPSKSMSVKIESFDNHTIKAVNAEADDKGPEIIAGIAKAGFSVAKLAIGLPAGPADAGGGAPTKLTCPATLALAKQITTAIEDRTNKLIELNGELEPYVVTGLIGTLTDADKTAISELRKKIRAASKALSDLREKLDEQEKQLSLTEAVDLDFAPAALDREIAFPNPDPAIAALQVKWLNQSFGAVIPDADLKKIYLAMKPLTATLRRVNGTSPDASVCAALGLGSCFAGSPEWEKNAQGRLPRAIPGIAYRQPVRARLRVCRGATAAVCAAGGAKPIVEAEGWAPQIGMLVVLPFTNGFGVNNQLQAQFRADGSLDWASYANKRAVGLAAVNTLNDVLDGGLALSDAIAAKREAGTAAEKAEATAAAAAKVTAAQNALAIAQAESQLATVQAAMDPANQTIARQQALLNARVAQLTSELQIRELEAKLQP